MVDAAGVSNLNQFERAVTISMRQLHNTTGLHNERMTFDCCSFISRLYPTSVVVIFGLLIAVD